MICLTWVAMRAAVTILLSIVAVAVSTHTLIQVKRQRTRLLKRQAVLDRLSRP